MSDIRRSMAMLGLAIALVGCGTAGPPGTPLPSGGPETSSTTPGPSPRPTRRPTSSPTCCDAATPKPTKRPKPTPTPAPTPFPEIPGLDELLGDDERLTLLLLGTDKRRGIAGERTDTILVATIDPATGRVAMVSLPRDTEAVPIGRGITSGGRINELFGSYLAGEGSRRAALRRMKRAIGYAMDIEIDHYVIVGFYGVRRLIKSIGGVDVVLDRALVDTTSHVSDRGLILRRGRNHLNGKKALAFARSRHSDNDYERARRQQVLIAAAGTRVRKRGLDALPALVDMARKHVETDVPWSAAPALLALAARVRLDHFKSVVLGPSKFAGQGSELYTTVLKIDVVREALDRIMGR